MKILNVEQIREWDRFTINQSSLTSIDLVNTASTIFANWLDKKLRRDDMTVIVVCGTGNNGADGFRVAQILLDRGVDASCAFITSSTISNECEYFKKEFTGSIFTIHNVTDIPDFKKYTFIVDAIFGSGLTREPQGIYAEVILAMNQFSNKINSIDIPSGVYADHATYGLSVYANETLSFERPKISFFAKENAARIGKWVYRSIGLNTKFLNQINSKYSLITKVYLKDFLIKRNKFDFKNIFGHALLIGGQKGMAGSILLSSKASYRMGCGLVDIMSDESNRTIIQGGIWEAMFLDFKAEIDFTKYKSVGIGPGLGKHADLLNDVIKNVESHLVIDADGLNIIAEKKWLHYLPVNTVLTPHPGEFKRLFGNYSNDFDAWNIQRAQSLKYKIYIILKGAHSSISTPDGSIFFNNTGNPGMATAGSGDVLLGMVCGLLSQGYTADQACLLAVYMHGQSGDLAIKQIGEESLMAGDLIKFLKESWKIMKS